MQGNAMEYDTVQYHTVMTVQNSTVHRCEPWVGPQIQIEFQLNFELKREQVVGVFEWIPRDCAC